MGAKNLFRLANRTKGYMRCKLQAPVFLFSPFARLHTVWWKHKQSFTSATGSTNSPTTILNQALHSISFLLVLLRILGGFSETAVMPLFCDIAKNLLVLATLVILCCRTVSLRSCAIVLSVGSCKENAGVVIALSLCGNDYIPFLCALLQNACVLDPLICLKCKCSLALLITYAGIVGFRLWCPWPSCELTVCCDSVGS